MTLKIYFYKKQCYNVVQEGKVMTKVDLSGYAKKFEDDVTSFNDYEATDYVRSLKNEGLLDEAIEVGSTFRSMCPNLKGYINQYGYALYNKHINIPVNKISENEFLFFSFANDILGMCKQEKYSPYEVTVNRMIKYITSQNPINYDKYLETLKLLDPKLLSDQPLLIKERNQEGESPLERWYRQMVKVHYDMQNYKDCITYANNALAMIHNFHYRNLQWIKYYRACSQVALGNYEEGQRDFLALQGQIRDINFYEVLYTTYSSLNDDKKANTFLLYDLYQSGYDVTKTDLFNNLLKACQKAEYTALADLVSLFLKKVEKEAGKITEIENDPYANEDSGIIYDRLMEELTAHLDKLVERVQGKVIYYNKEKQFGNIKTPQDDTIFFRQADYIYDEEVQKYDVVEYTVIPAYDRKKDEQTSRAVLLTLEYSD